MPEEAEITSINRHLMDSGGSPLWLPPQASEIFCIFWAFYSWKSYFVSIPNLKTQNSILKIGPSNYNAKH